MAEMSRVSPVNAALAGLADMKGRGVETDDTGTNFVDVMLARVTAHQNSKDDLKDIVRDYDTSPAADDDAPKWVDHLKQAEPAKDSQDSRKPADKKSADDSNSIVAGKGGCVAPKDEPKKTPEPSDKLAEPVAAKDDAPAAASSDLSEKEAAEAIAAVTAASEAGESIDVKALKGLQKLANMLLDAEKDGKLALPANLKLVLEKIAGTSATEPGQVLPLLQNLLTSLRKLEDSKTAAELQKVLGEVKWPQEMVKLFTDLQVNVGLKADQPLTLGKLIKALRTLSHLAKSENKGEVDSAIPNTAALPLVLNQAKEDKKAAESENDIVDVLTGTTKDKKKAALDAVLAADGLATQSLNVPNSQQKPDLNNHPLNPLVGGAAGHKPSLSDLSRDAFSRGAKQDSYTGGGRADGAASAAAASNGGSGLSGMSFEAPKVDAPSSSTPTSPLSAAVLAGRAAAAFSTPSVPNGPSVPNPVTQQVIVQISKSNITKDTQLSIQLNPAELGKVDVKITIDQHGKTSAHIIAERPETLALLQKDGNLLERALQQAGLSSSAQDLHYSLKEQAQQRGSGEGGRRRQALFDGDEDAKTVTVDTHMRDDGLQHRINYQA